ncbi:23015_t:CDS:2, partial [Gigaspora rosea]
VFFVFGVAGTNIRSRTGKLCENKLFALLELAYKMPLIWNMRTYNKCALASIVC